MSRAPFSYPAYARSERIADGVIHAVGVAFAVIGGVVLTIAAVLHADGGAAVAVGVYGVALMATFLASACYHMTPWASARPALRRLDHAAIYIKIAGTYTPLVVLIGSAFSYGVLAVVWGMAIAGALANVFVWHDPGRLGVAAYLLLGWIGVLLVWPLAATLPLAAMLLVGAGGGLYTLGVVFFSWESLKFANAIWHAFVLAASGCFFAAIAVGVLGGPA